MLILLGAPGAGKDTFGARLSEDLSLPIFSVGDCLRYLVRGKKAKPLIEKAKKIVSEGRHDGLIVQIICTRLLQADADHSSLGIILDGFPMTVAQAKKLETACRVKAVINFFGAEGVLVEKLAGQRECGQCHESYNVAMIRKEGYEIDPVLPKKNEGKCDKCGEPLVQPEDRPETIVERLKEYREKIAPLEDYYKSKGVLSSYEPKKGVADYPWIKTEIEHILDSPPNSFSLHII